MSESILSNTKECYVCYSMRDLHKHHIFYGTSNRMNSERQGCWCYLCDYHHNMSSMGVHFNQPFDATLKKLCQLKWEEINGDREQFRQIFGKSYL